jgi:thiol-disulfide isomerase/thioredoxin
MGKNNLLIFANGSYYNLLSAKRLKQMKKFLPAFIISIMFTVVLVTQMAVNGQSSNAAKVDENKAKYSVYEDQFSKTKLITTKKTEINLSKQKQPIIVLNFWASWCQPCLAEFQTLKKFIKLFPKEDVLVIGINNDDENPKRAIKKTEKDLKLNFESTIDTDSKITSSFLVEKIPASIVFYKGKVIHYVNEEFDFMNAKFTHKIKMLLKKSSTKK